MKGGGGHLNQQEYLNDACKTGHVTLEGTANLKPFKLKRSIARYNILSNSCLPSGVVGLCSKQWLVVLSDLLKFLQTLQV